MARCLVRATPTEIGSPISLRTARRIWAISAGEPKRCSPGDVGEGLVDRDALDQGREVVEDRHRRVAEPRVLLEVAADEDELRAELAGPASRHAAAHAERLGLVGRCQHHAAADRDRLAAQGRIEQLLDRRVEGVEIGVEDGGKHEMNVHDMFFFVCGQGLAGPLV